MLYMKHFKRLLIVLLCLMPFLASADEISLHQARQIAEEFFSGQPLTRASDITLEMVWDGSDLQTKTSGGGAAFYVFDNVSGPGFVIVAGNDVAKPILGYSFENEFVMENMPPNVRAWMEGLKDAISRASRSYSFPGVTKASVGDVVVKHETAEWDQGYPYNVQCPADGGYRSVTGCVATAIAIVLRYHQWPEAGTGTIPAYTTRTKGIEVPEIALGAEYDWSRMPLTYDGSGWDESSILAVSRLMADCGAMVKMDYSSDESGAYDMEIPTALSTYMDYDGSIGWYRRGVYSDSQWHEMLVSELQNNGPIIYTGQAEGGHAFVLDGYTTERYYSVNWGWSGYFNGYFTLDALNPEGQGTGGYDGGYNSWQAAILNVKKDAGGTEPVRAVIHAYEDIYGLVANTTDFRKNVPFTVSTGLIVNASHVRYDGFIGFAHADRNDVVKEVPIYYQVSLDMNYGHYFHDLEITLQADIEIGDKLIVVVWDADAQKWIKALAEKEEGCVDEIPLRDRYTIEESTAFRYSTETKTITLAVKDGVSAEVRDSSGSVVRGVVRTDGTEIQVSTSLLEAGSYVLVLTKGNEVKEVTFIVGAK